MTGQTIALLCAFLVAHYLGDFTPLATRRMQEAKVRGEPILIAAHAGVHALLVVLATLLIAAPGWKTTAIVAAFIFTTHFALDFLRPALARRFPALADPGQSVFWYFLGLDQLGHGLVLIFAVTLIV
jgi:lipid-A-disaccharide synthase-like uncharacterized protein